MEDFLWRYVLGGRRAMSHLEERTRDFARVKKRMLQGIIRRNEATAWGRDHGWSKLTVDDWDSQPVVTYDDVGPYVDRIRTGDFRSLTSEPAVALAWTSGTTGQSKLIPFTESFLASQIKASNYWTYIFNTTAGRRIKKVLFLRGDMAVGQTEILPVRSYLSIAAERQKAAVKRRFVLDERTSTITDLEHKFLVAAQAAFIFEPNLLLTVTPVSILRWADMAGKYRELIYNATRAGVYAGTDFPIRGMRDKAKALKRILKGGVLDSVELAGTWMGGTQQLHIAQLRERGFEAELRDLGYCATEGRFTIPMESGTSRGLLNPFGGYYEFMTTDKKELVPTEELVPGREYNLVVTTLAGLYRYDMQDVIRMDGWYNAAPLISFRRKDAGFSAMAGEKIHENNVVELLERIGLREGFLVAEADPVRYVLCVRSGYAGPGSAEVDRLLCDINDEYEENRGCDRLMPLEVRVLSEAEFAEVDARVNPNQDHDRFKRRYLVPLDAR